MMQYPMDSPVSECLAFYPMCEANFIMSSDVMKDARWHRIKRGIWDAIESYRIIELHESENKDREVGVKKLSRRNGSDLRRLHIANTGVGREGCQHCAVSRDRNDGIIGGANKRLDYKKCIKTQAYEIVVYGNVLFGGCQSMRSFVRSRQTIADESKTEWVCLSGSEERAA